MTSLLWKLYFLVSRTRLNALNTQHYTKWHPVPNLISSRCFLFWSFYRAYYHVQIIICTFHLFFPCEIPNLDFFYNNKMNEKKFVPTSFLCSWWWSQHITFKRQNHQLSWLLLIYAWYILDSSLELWSS